MDEDNGEVACLDAGVMLVMIASLGYGRLMSLRPISLYRRH